MRWRSTEPDENTDPDKYPAPFRLQPEALPKLPVIPAACLAIHAPLFRGARR